MLISATSTLLLINSLRKPKLTIDPFLINLAETRCQDAQEFTHKDYYNIYSKIIENKYHFTGENLAVGFSDASSTVKAWKNSKTHYEIMTSKNFQKIGIATCTKCGGGYCANFTVSLFGGQKIK